MTAAASPARWFAAAGIAALAGCHAPLHVGSTASEGLRPFPTPPPEPSRSRAAATAPGSGPGAVPARAPAEAGSGAAATLPWSPRQAPDSGRFDLFVDPMLGAFAQDPATPQEPARDARESRWSDFLPLGRDAVLAAGYELPRAFGFGVAYTRLQRDIEVDEVRTGLAGAPLAPVGFLAVASDSTVDNVMGRLDAWIFPFWNVSALGGWTWNESQSDVTVTIPLPVNPQSVTFAVPTRQEGPTWGVGTNLSAGYGEWFISGDGQWIRVDMQDFATIEAFLGSIRSGWNGKIDGVPVRFWGGVTYWDTATTIAGSVPTPAGELRFEVDQGPVTPYSLQIGANVDLDAGHGAMVELHLFDDVRMVVFALALRF